MEETIRIVKRFIEEQRITCPEVIYQTDRVAEKSLEFIQELCEQVGYAVRAIEMPWEEGACHECTHCYADDMCNAHKLITSDAFCPHVRMCKSFKKKT